jgi:hypothetical protein
LEGGRLVLEEGGQLRINSGSRWWTGASRIEQRSNGRAQPELACATLMFQRVLSNSLILPPRTR